MKKIMLFAFVSLVSIAAFAQKPMPSVDIKTLEGKSLSAKKIAQAGTVTVVSFWATWCAPCKKELDVIHKNYAGWQEKYGMSLAAVTIDDAQGLPKVRPTVAQKGWKFPVYSDINSALMQNLGIPSVPYTIIVDKNGNIVYEHSGYKAGDEIELEKKIAEFSKK
jgi:cytochrome c biogenesis protein CcmG, thiol:disulfide interchange protein DsbE